MKHSLASLSALLLLPLAASNSDSHVFTPTHRLSGIGVDRGSVSDVVLEKRTELMIENQTFAILRDSRAAAGAQRITSPRLQHIFKSTEAETGFPASTLSAVAYLESWGESDAQSPAGPRGIMQASEGTARAMGMKIVRVTRYRVTTDKQLVKKRKGKPAYRTVRHRTPYTEMVRDERLIPERAIPAAGRYLARLEHELGGRDWAIFAYHCGEGCVSEFQALAEKTPGLGHHPSVAKVFFTGSPAQNRRLYDLIQHHMERDYSPTYWFRIMRAEQLLAMYQRDPEEFKTLAADYQLPGTRASHRLAVWLKDKDLAYRSLDDIKGEQGKRLVKVDSDADFYGFKLNLTAGDAYQHASPAVLGAIAYIAFETRRLHEAVKPKGEHFVPLEVLSLWQPLDQPDTPFKSRTHTRQGQAAHSSCEVFDLGTANLPPGERESLMFVLDDIGWDGYLGFVQEGAATDVMHIGPSPSAREFFSEVSQEIRGRER